MKNKSLFLLLFCLIIMLMSGCEYESSEFVPQRNDTIFNCSPLSYSFDIDGGSTQIKLNSTLFCVASSDKQWLTVTPDSINGSRSAQTITICATAGEADVATITIADTIGKNELFFKVFRIDVSSRWPSGALPGEFSVSPDRKVKFSVGNLCYDAGDAIWSFSSFQYKYVGLNNDKLTLYGFDGSVDLFGWGTAGSPLCVSQDNAEYGLLDNDISFTNYDWGVSNPIANGMNESGKWRTLSKTEWEYILNERTDVEPPVHAYVCGINGMMIFPDDFRQNAMYKDSTLFHARSMVDGVRDFDVAQFVDTLEMMGAVFLPFSGVRNVNVIHELNVSGYYWTSTCYDEDNAYYLSLHDFGRFIMYGNKQYGRAVRLVKDVP